MISRILDCRGIRILCTACAARNRCFAWTERYMVNRIRIESEDIFSIALSVFGYDDAAALQRARAQKVCPICKLMMKHSCFEAETGRANFLAIQVSADNCSTRLFCGIIERNTVLPANDPGFEHSVGASGTSKTTALGIVLRSVKPHLRRQACELSGCEHLRRATVTTCACVDVLLRDPVGRHMQQPARDPGATARLGDVQSNVG